MVHQWWVVLCRVALHTTSKRTTYYELKAPSCEGAFFIPSITSTSLGYTRRRWGYSPDIRRCHGYSSRRILQINITFVNTACLRAMKIPITLLLTALTFLAGCAGDSTPVIEPTVEERYRAAVIDAMVADDNEKSSNLIAITKDNPLLSWKTIDGQEHVLVTTWTSWDTSYVPDQKASALYEMWVTAIPELQLWWKSKYDYRTDTSLRLEQLLGLSAGRKKTKFLSIWVRPQDMFRPAGDNEITDNTAGPELPSKADSAYRVWFNSSIIYSYYPKTAPWTRLGYTYDWNGQYGEQGLSEFIVHKGAPVVVHSVRSTSDFLRQ